MSTYLIKAQIKSRVEVCLVADDYEDCKRTLFHNLIGKDYISPKILYSEITKLDDDEDLDLELIV